MSDPLAAAKLKAETAYNAAADYYGADPLGFWARYGRRTVERLRLRRGAHVLDVCCGTGASALPAAQAVNPERQVSAVELAGELLKLGQAKAQTAGLQCVEFRRGDMTDLAFPIVILTRWSVCLGFSLSRTWNTRWRNCDAWCGPADNWRSPHGAHDFGVRPTR